MYKRNIAFSMIAFTFLCESLWATGVKIPTIKQTVLPMPLKPTYNISSLPSAVKPNKIKQTKTISATLPRYKEGEVIVKYKENIQKTNLQSLLSSQGLKVTKSYSTLSKKNMISVLKSNKTTIEMIKLLKADPNVESASPNYIRYIKSTPNDPRFDDLWGMHNTGQTGGVDDADIDAPEAWNIRTGSAGVVVAVFDTGIDYTHQDLIANLWVNQGEITGDKLDNDGNGYIDDIYGYDVAVDSLGNNDGDPLDVHGHGTHVSGTIGAKGNDNFGVSGVNWNVKIMTLKIFAPGAGAYDSDILEAIEYIHTMKQRGVNIVSINASYGGGGGEQSDPMNTAIQGLGDAGIIFCAAAGNDGTDNDDTAHFPSSYDANNIIAVASTNDNDELSWFSNYGETSVDIAAPGSSILSTMKYKIDYTPQANNAYFVDIDGSESWDTSSNDSSTWSLNDAYTQSTPYSLTDSPDTDYLNDQVKAFTPHTSIDLTAIANKNLSFGFYAKLDLEDDYDFLYVSFSADGGTNWSEMRSFNGEGVSMQAYSIEIPDSFQTNNFLYRFTFVSDGSITYDGVYIDDIGIDIGTRTSNRYASWSGTSMATPHVTGAIGLMATAYHGEGVQDRISRILSERDYLPSLNGKVVTNGRMNINTSIRMQLGDCPANKHVNQGTPTCIKELVSTYPKEIPAKKVCPSGEQLDQGTQNCIAGTLASDPGEYPDQPDCELIQGTDTCVTP